MTKPDRKAAYRFIVALGFVSLFADMTYEGAHSVIGPLLKDLGASATQVGIIAGLGEMIAASLRYFSGKLADKTRAYWTISTLGYFLNLVVVPGLAFAGSWKTAALLIIAERTGKSLRGPARDVLLSEATEVVGHGAGFGLHAAMDQTGAVLGPLLVAAAVARSHHFGPAFIWLAVPALGAFIALIFGRLFDRFGIQVIVLGIIVSLLALPFGFLGGANGVYVSVACWAIGLGAQDATLRSGISQVVSMNKRGTAFGSFNAAYGVLWSAGSVTMGILYDFSLVAMVVFGIAAQLVAAVIFLTLRSQLRKPV